ncbi:formyl transferase, partial [Francisella tularensis subsp. holarctica]|nr:formyl transferase [Francisella tularensis subsp. holarctica]
IVTMREAIDYLRAMTHPTYKNSYFIDEHGNKVFVALELE